MRSQVIKNGKFPQIVISISGLEQQIHQLINQERQQYNLTLLTFDTKLSHIARQHSQDMADNAPVNLRPPPPQIKIIP